MRLNIPRDNFGMFNANLLPLRRIIMKKESKLILIILILFVAACNKTGDPVFASTYLGGNGHEFCEAIALDDDGNIYVAGNTRSLDFPTTTGAYNRDLKGKSDVFIAKFDNEL